MNAPFNPPPTLDSLHMQRSRCLDAFASLEEVLVSLLGALKIRSGSESLGQKLAALAKAQPNPEFSKARLENLLKLLPACEMLVTVRNDIVHAKMHTVRIEDEPKACFINTRDCFAGSKSARIFSDQGLCQLRSDICRMTVELRQALINQAFLPPRPSPGVAGGP